MDFADWQKAKVVKYLTCGEGLLCGSPFHFKYDFVLLCVIRRIEINYITRLRKDFLNFHWVSVSVLAFDELVKVLRIAITHSVSFQLRRVIFHAGFHARKPVQPRSIHIQQITTVPAGCTK